jgi:ferrous iron transport protein B
MTIALVGNPNSGKTTLFNALTGGRAHTGNWPGVTVDKREGVLRLDGVEHVLVDLPGIYSLDPDTAEQVLARDYLMREDVGLIVNVADAGSLERSLLLTLELIKLGKLMVLTLNMLDELEAGGASLDTARLGTLLGVRTVGVSAAKKKNLDTLTALLGSALRAGPPRAACPNCAGCTKCGVGLSPMISQ